MNSSDEHDPVHGGGSDAIAAEVAATQERVAMIRRLVDSRFPIGDALEVLSDVDGTHPSVRRSILGRRDIPAAVFAFALRDPDPGVRALAVMSSATPLESVLPLAEDPFWSVRKEVAMRPDLPLPILTTLLDDGDALVRLGAISNPRVPSRRLADVFIRSSTAAELAVAIKHPGFNPYEHVVKLAGASPVGALSLLASIRLPAELFERFAFQDQTVETRRLVANHTTCPPHVLAMLALNDPSPLVREDATHRTELPIDALMQASRDPVTDVRNACLTRGDCPADVVSTLLRDTEPKTRELAAAHANADPESLRSAAMDPILGVRLAVLGNIRCPSEILEDACTDEETVLTAIMNPACGSAGWFPALVTLAQQTPASGDDPDPNVKKKKGTATKIATARRKAAVNLSAFEWEVLRKYRLDKLAAGDLATVIAPHLSAASLDRRVAIRLAAIAHPAVDPTDLARLASDPNVRVRDAVTKRIIRALGA